MRIVILLYYIYPLIKGVNFVFSEVGIEPHSFSLFDNKIFIINSIGVHIFHNQGRLVSSNSYLNKTSVMEASYMKDESIVAFNGQELFYFTKEGRYVTQFNYPYFANQGLTDYYSVSSYSNDAFLLIGNIRNKLYLTLMNKELRTATENSFNVPVSNYVTCMKRILDMGIFCGFIMDNAERNLGVLLVTKTFAISKLLKVPTTNGSTLRIKKVSHHSFLLCYINTNNAIGCAFFSDEKSTLSPTFSIADNTENTKHTQLDMVSLSSKEILIVYAYNVGFGFIKLQKINYKGQLIESPLALINSQTRSKITNLDIITFVISDSLNLYGVAYGLNKDGLYFEELDISFCSDYCASVELTSTYELNLRIYSSSPFIFFTSTVTSGRLKYFNEDIVLNTQYSSFYPFIYTSGRDKTLVTANFQAKNPNGVSSQCVITLIVGEKGKCTCMNPLFTFQTECVKTCPVFTYIDYDKQECTNCASISKFFYQNQCKSKEDLPPGVYIADIIYNVVEDCEAPCSTCVDNKDHCLSCLPGNNCHLDCNEGYFHSFRLGQCVKCYETCSTCSDTGDIDDHKCNKCLDGYQVLPSFPKQCNPTCKDSSKFRWYIDDNKKINCIQSVQCPQIKPIYTIENNQCVESCSKVSTCLLCQSTAQTMYNDTNTCVIKCPVETITNQKTNQCDQGPNIDIGITNKPVNETLDDLDTSIITKPNSTIIKGDDYVIEIINSTEKGGNLQLSQIDFLKCEAVLRKQYSIPQSEVLFIVKLDLDRKTEVTSQVEYEVYDSKGVKLDLKYCDNTTVDIVYTIKNTSVFDVDLAKEYAKKGIDIYNPQDPFFTDICFPFSSENGTDITLKDRLGDIYANVSLCENSCEYKGVNLTEMSITCTCNVKPKINTEINANFFLQGLSSAFTDSNFMVVTCYNLVFKPSILVNNVGFWFYLTFVILHLPNWILYFTNGLLPIKNYFGKFPKASPLKKIKVKDYIDKNSAKETISDNDDQNEAPKCTEDEQKKEKDSIAKNKKPFKNKISLFKGKSEDENSLEVNSSQMNDEHNVIISDTITHTIALGSLNEIQNNNDTSMSKPKLFKKDSITSIRTYNSNFLFNEYEKNDINFSKDFREFIDISTGVEKRRNEQSNNLKNEKVSKKERFNDSKFFPKDKRKMVMATTSVTSTYQETINHFKIETKVKKKKPSMEILDDFDLISAKLYDNRSFWRLMYICLLVRHPILSTFVKKCYFSLRTIIIIQFIFGNSMDFAFNALFYTEKLISQRYNYTGNLGFLFTLQNNIITSVASFLVSMVVGAFLNFLSSSENKLESLLHYVEDKPKYNSLLKKTMICLKWKLGFFLFFEMIFMLFFWYYSMAFCAVYQNSQISWLTGGFITFAIGLLFPFPICLLIILIRYGAISKQYNCIFKTSIWCYKL